MADIRQAAKWMQEGKRVRRKGWDAQYGTASKAWLIRWLNGNPSLTAPFSTHDLLADDWEIVT